MDIVERLRRINAFLHVTEDEPEYDYKLSHEAADEIERLREALQFYSSFADALPHENIAPLMIDRGNKAAAALKKENP